MKHIAVLTGGGDCPGLNAVIRAVVRTASGYGLKVTGVRDGFKGLIHGHLTPLDLASASGLLHRGGTILGTTNRDNPFRYAVKEGDELRYIDMSGQVMANLKHWEIDGLIVIGGDGSLSIARDFHRLGLPVVGVPKTIDNDLSATDVTFGFDSAVTTAVEALDKLHTTAESHHRVMLLEVMGRYAGWIALHAGIAGGADVIVIPEIPYTTAKIIEAINRRLASGKRFSIIVVAEGAKPVGGDYTVQRIVPGSHEQLRLGGVSHRIAAEIEEQTGLETRVTILGHLQRGGSPTPRDRLLASRFGVHAVKMLISGEFGRMAALHGGDIVSVPLEEATGKLKTVPPDCRLVAEARCLDISFGD
ncbi:6-phosphofructokinase [Thermosinus carboxydivorans Nor1]|uniref:ATP-dependent 6-phosphofructokinase n=1 Tax=Thermosinus carboxydivorans Nor1 TaxID=401526 RepID=A1HT27_9FIRM|nr:ATP-dependent 6-phosphofructokinase [Thermosinus carboxydivorans]EAX46794.1 6-phosphofructokinase [Thermosinus carboxydivorans Nor1]